MIREGPGPLTVGDVLDTMTASGDTPPDFTALVDWVNSGGCPAAVAEASRRLNALLQGSADGIPVSPDSGERVWEPILPGQSAELLGLSADGCFIIETGQPKKGSPTRVKVRITDVTRMWLDTPKAARGKFPLTPLFDAWCSSNSAAPVSARHIVAPSVLEGISGHNPLPLARAPALLAIASTPLQVVEVDGAPVASPSTIPMVFYQSTTRPGKGVPWPAPRTIGGVDTSCAILSTLAGYPLETDERSPLRSDVYRIVVLAHALSGPTSIPTSTGVRWLTGGQVTHAARRRFWDAMNAADSLRITVNPDTHEWRRLAIADPYNGGVRLSPPEWLLVKGQNTGGFRLTGALWRPAVLSARSGKGTRGVGVWGGLHRTLAGIEAALAYGPTGGHGKGARLSIHLRPQRKGGPGPDVFIPWRLLLTLAGEHVPHGADGKGTAGRRYRRRVEDLADLGYFVTGSSSPAGDTVEIVDQVSGGGYGSQAGIVVRASDRFVEACQRSQNTRAWQSIPASTLLESRPFIGAR